MKCLPVLTLGVLLLSAPAFAQEKAQKSAAAKTMAATGVVSAIDAEWITIKAKGSEWKFSVDKSTHVSVVGATRKTAVLKDDKKPKQINEYVKIGDSVTVKYHDMGATKHAADVIVRSSIKK
jgi:hypothetical protein